MATVTTGYTFTANETNITHTKLNNAVGNATVTNIVAADITDSTITNAKIANGTIDIASKVTGTLAVANGGTGGATQADARTGLGLGTAAVANTGTSAGNVVVLDGSAKLPAVDGSQLTGFGTAAAEDVGTSAGNVVQLDGSAKLPAVDGSQLTNLPSSVPAYVLVSDTQPQNTAAATLSSGVNTARISTEDADTGNNASVGSNKVTLAAGTYRLRGWVSVGGANIYKIYLCKASDGTVYATGAMDTATGLYMTIPIQGRFTLSGSTALELRINSNGSGTQGSPANVSGLSETYLQLEFEKE